MKRHEIQLMAFVVLSALQLGAPLSMIAKRELALAHGDEVRVRTQPVDPYDAFRGRYVALRLDAGHPTWPEDMRLQRRQRVFVTFDVDEEGFATFGEVRLERPAEVPYLETRVRHMDRSKRRVWVDRPFDRYYLNEKDAPAAETAYRRHSRRKERDAYVTLRLYRGFAVIDELYVADTPILEFVREARKKDGNPDRP